MKGFKEFFENNEDSEESEFYTNWSPEREFWIANGRIIFDQLGSSGEASYEGVHERLAKEYIASKYLDCIYSYAKTLGDDIPALNYPSDDLKFGVLLEYIRNKMFSKDIFSPYIDADLRPTPEERKAKDELWVQNIPLVTQNYKEIWKKINKQCPNFDYEAFTILGKGTISYFLSDLKETPDTKYYLMKNDNWILWRGADIELYGFDTNKLNVIKKVLPEVFQKEKSKIKYEAHIGIFDHKTKRNMEFKIKDILEGNILRPQSPESTTKSNIALPIPQGKQYGRELWRGTGD